MRTPKIGARLRQLRRQRGLSQGDIQKRTGLLRCYISRVENGHTVPSLETLERFIAALEIPFYQFFYFDEDPTPHLTQRASLEELAEESAPSGPEAHFLSKLRAFISQIAERDRDVLLAFANRLAGHAPKNG